MMEQSFDLLHRHPVNEQRRVAGLRPANAIWIWGEGRKPALPDFYGKYGVKGAVISAVDLIKGIGLCAGLHSIEVEGATGTIHSNITGKGLEVITQLASGKDFVFVHIEAPDESGHRNELENKIKAIERIDGEVVAPVWQWLKSGGEPYSILLLPDHPTPMRYNTHTADPVPFLIYRSQSPQHHTGRTYSEAQATQTGLVIEQGFTLMDRFLKNC
jgi:2,3-bisphosphoglycerate-independent phosphoglycerate mutase